MLHAWRPTGLPLGAQPGKGKGKRFGSLQLPWNYLRGKQPVRLLWSLLEAQETNALGSGAHQRAEEFQQLEFSDPFILWEISAVSKAGSLHQYKLLGSGTAFCLVSCLALVWDKPAPAAHESSILLLT